MAYKGSSIRLLKRVQARVREVHPYSVAPRNGGDDEDRQLEVPLPLWNWLSPLRNGIDTLKLRQPYIKAYDVLITEYYSVLVL